jgi:outer membrane protein assembly factor BamB
MQRFVLSVLFVAALQLPVSAQEWTRFRGPNGTGISDATTIPATWTDADYKWNIDLPGTGHSSPVVWGTKLFVTACEEKTSTRLLLCISTTDGSVLWEKELQLKTDKKHKNNSFASSTPCVNADHVVVAWHSKTSSPLIAYDHDGNEAWRYEQGPYLHGQGAATSPIVYQDMVVIANDQQEPSFLLAVDAKTGKERWKIPREGKRACYVRVMQRRVCLPPKQDRKNLCSLTATKASSESTRHPANRTGTSMFSAELPSEH